MAGSYRRCEPPWQRPYRRPSAPPPTAHYAGQSSNGVKPLAEVGLDQTTSQGLHGQRGLGEVAERLEDVAKVPSRLGDAGTAFRALRAGAVPVVALQRPYGDLA